MIEDPCDQVEDNTVEDQLQDFSGIHLAGEISWDFHSLLPFRFCTLEYCGE